MAAKKEISEKRMHNSGKKSEVKATQNKKTVTTVNTTKTAKEEKIAKAPAPAKTSKSKKPVNASKQLLSKQTWKPGNMLYPLPAVMVSCARPGEKPNIITIAWTGTICSDPVMASISVRKERYSYDIIKETGEFVINLTTEDLVRATDYCGVRSGRDHDKFAELGLTAAPASKLSCPIIAESPVNIECKVKEILPLGSHDMFIAEVVAVNVSEAYMDKNGKFDLNRTGLTVYSHGEYFGLGQNLGRFGFSVKKTSHS